MLRRSTNLVLACGFIVLAATISATLSAQPTVDAAGVGGVRAGGISPPSTGSGPGVYGPSAPRAQVAPNGC